MDIDVLGREGNTSERRHNVEGLCVVPRLLVVTHHNGIERLIETVHLADGRIKNLARRNFTCSYQIGEPQRIPRPVVFATEHDAPRYTSARKPSSF